MLSNAFKTRFFSYACSRQSKSRSIHSPVQTFSLLSLTVGLMESLDVNTAREQTNGTMENGHAGDGNGVALDVPVDSKEFRVLMAYAKRRRPTDKRLQCLQEVNDETQETVPKKKKKKKFRLKLPSCIRPQTKDTDSFSGPLDGSGPAPASMGTPRGQPETEDDEVADKLTQISTTVPFHEGDLDTDCPQDIVQELAKLLRDSGDELNEKIKKDKALLDRLQNSFSYGFFSSVVTAFLGKADLSSTESPEEEEEARVAMTCEAVTRFSTMATLPVSQTMGFGARYLHDNSSAWFRQHGGREEDSKPDVDDGGEVDE